MKERYHINLVGAGRSSSKSKTTKGGRKKGGKVVIPGKGKGR